MKPAKFTYHAPDTLEQVFRLLAQYGDEAKVIAGGQSLVPVMNLRLAQPEHLVDINGIADISGISENDGRVMIGALTRHSEVVDSPLIRARCPILCEAGTFIGHWAIRNRGTVGGSLSHADPAAEWSLMAILLNAEMTVRSASAVRTAQAADFIQSIYTTDLEAEEILTSVSFPVLGADEGWSIRQISRRAGDFAIVAVAVTLRLDDEGTVADFRLALGGMDATPIRLHDVEQSALGQRPDADWIVAVGDAAARAGSPDGDVHASADYRRDVCPVLTERALIQALARARGES